ncbi:hypothetical protein CRG98_030078 [Punica granatum]|uniref:Uncharacterized protein n=1 Tax=Punica granatum TaxID=22663 RepID=A0A2I0IZW4_PUNGR|nr:hypothetical protein CRG98_030078 [Punica granatum]
MKKRRSCLVARLSDSDHLVTRESEGREEPLENDGTTRQSRERKESHLGLKRHQEPESMLISSRGLETSNAKTKLGNGLRMSKTCGERHGSWLGSWLGLAWLARGSHLAREKVGRSSVLDRSKCSGGPRTRKLVLLRLEDRNKVDHFCRLFTPQCAELLVSACFVLRAKRLTRRPRLKIENQRRPRNPRPEFSLCFPSVLMYSETAAISIYQKGTPKISRTDNLSKRYPAMFLCRKGPLFLGSASTREINMISGKQSDSCSLVLVTLGCEQDCFRMPLILPWSGRPEIPVRKAFVTVRDCPDLTRCFLKCAGR